MRWETGNAQLTGAYLMRLAGRGVVRRDVRTLGSGGRLLFVPVAVDAAGGQPGCGDRLGGGGPAARRRAGRGDARASLRARRLDSGGSADGEPAGARPRARVRRGATARARPRRLRPPCRHLGPDDAEKADPGRQTRSSVSRISASQSPSNLRANSLARDAGPPVEERLSGGGDQRRRVLAGQHLGMLAVRRPAHESHRFWFLNDQALARRGIAQRRVDEHPVPGPRCGDKKACHLRTIGHETHRGRRWPRVQASSTGLRRPGPNPVREPPGNRHAGPPTPNRPVPVAHPLNAPARTPQVRGGAAPKARNKLAPGCRSEKVSISFWATSG